MWRYKNNPGFIGISSVGKEGGHTAQFTSLTQKKCTVLLYWETERLFGNGDLLEPEHKGGSVDVRQGM